MSIAILAIIVSGMLSACGSGRNDTGIEPDGRKVYMQQCTLCHGADGKLQLSGATNLATSQLSKPEIIEVVTNGRNNMQPFSGLLSDAHISAVSEYIITLRETN